MMKKGISLIVLVITIIVMIILAASVIIAMTNNGIIDRASQAVQLTDEKQVQDLAAIAWAEAYLDEDRTDTLEKVVKDALVAQGVTLTEWNIDVSEKGVSVTKKGVVVQDDTIVDFDISMGSFSTSSAYYQANQEYPVGLGYAEDIKRVTFYTKVNGESDDKYVPVKVKFYYESNERSEITAFAGALTGVIVVGMDPEVANIIKVVYEFKNGDIKYAVSAPTEIACFVAGTKVYTESGLMNIEDVKEGMKVYSRNLETGANELREVLATSVRTIRTATYKVTVNGEVIESTDNHPYYVKGKDFVEAKDLVKGDVLVDANGEEHIIESVELIDNSNVVTVYNMNVEGNHNYYVGDSMVLVHNAGCPT